MGNDTDQPVPPGVDTTKPSMARVYDYFLSGKAHFEIDQVVGEKIRSLTPEAYDIANNNRIFVRRATRRLVRDGITQFIDVGAGLPTQQNTHEVAHGIDPNVKVVYVDNDPIVKAHAEDLLKGDQNVVYLAKDAREPASILDDPDTRRLIDFSRPVGLIMTGVMHFVSPELDPYALVRRYLDAVPSGSYLALTHFTSDDQALEKVHGWHEATKNAVDSIYFRKKSEIEPFFEGLELLVPYEGARPELVWANVWGSPEPKHADPAGSWLWSGVARKP